MEHGFSRIRELRNEAIAFGSVQSSEFKVQSRSKIAKRTQSLVSVDFYTYPNGKELGCPCNFYQTNPLRSARQFKVPGFRFQVVQELRNEAISEAVK